MIHATKTYGGCEVTYSRTPPHLRNVIPLNVMVKHNVKMTPSKHGTTPPRHGDEEDTDPWANMQTG